MSPCPGRDELRQFVNQELPAPAEEAVLAHVDRCAACLEALETLTTDLAPQRDVPKAGVDTHLSTRLLQRLLAVPAPDHGVAPLANEGLPTVPGIEVESELGRGGMGLVLRGATRSSTACWLSRCCWTSTAAMPT